MFSFITLPGGKHYHLRVKPKERLGIPKTLAFILRGKWLSISTLMAVRLVYTFCSALKPNIQTVEQTS